MAAAPCAGFASSLRARVDRGLPRVEAERRVTRAPAPTINSLPFFVKRPNHGPTAAFRHRDLPERGGLHRACLESLADCAQIVVVDSGSTDRTLAIVADFAARGFPIELHQRDWPGYASQKQFALEQVREPWVLSIDADEWLDADLRADLPHLLQAPEPSQAGGCRAC